MPAIVVVSMFNDYHAANVRASRGVDSSYVVKSKQEKAGNLVGTTTRTVSKDGKTLTLAGSLKNPKGDSVESTMVFDKQ